MIQCPFKLGQLNTVKQALAMTGLPLISDPIRAEALNHLGYAHPPA